MSTVDVNSKMDSDVETNNEASKNLNETLQKGSQKLSESLKQGSQKLNESMQQGSQKLNESISDVKNQLMTYGNQIQTLLNNVDAKVEGYKFSVESTENGLTIDAQFKATIQQKHTESN